MKKLNMIALGILSVAVLAGCSEPYEYEGTYRGIEGECQDVPGDRTMFRLTKVAAKDNVYQASMFPKYSSGGTFPTESKEAEISDDGSLTFTFVKAGEKGFIVNKPAINMIVKFVPRDAQHIYLEKWPVTMTPINKPNSTASFDLVSDRVIDYLGRKIGNDFPNQAGKNGICLKKII